MYIRDRIAVLAPVAVSAVLYFACVSRHLPLDENLSLAAECLQGVGSGQVVPFVWSVLLKLSWWLLPGSVAFRLGAVSAFCGVAAVACYVYAVSRLLPFAVVHAERNAKRGAKPYVGLVSAATFLGGLAFALSPAFFCVATRVGPMSTEIFLAALPFALASFCMSVERKLTRVYVVVLIGASAGFAGLEGAPGLLTLPFAFAMVWLSAVRDEIRPTEMCGYFTLGVVLAAFMVFGDELAVPRLHLSFPTGCMQPMLVAVAPALMLYRLMKTLYLRGWLSRLLFFGGWLAVCIGMAVLIVRSNPLPCGRAADRFVNRVLAEADGRRWIVSDGKLDDLLVFLKPAGMRLITARRKHDARYGTEIARWVKADFGDDADLVLSAELGPSTFLKTWFRRAGAVTNVHFVSLMKPALNGGYATFRPGVYCWEPCGGGRPEDVAALERRWREAWMSLQADVCVPGEPGAGLLRNWFATQGKAIGVLHQERGEEAEARKVYDFMAREIGAANPEPDGCLRPHAIDPGLNQTLQDTLAKLETIDALVGSERQKALAEVETSVLALFGVQAESAWMRDLVLGEVNRLRGGGATSQARVFYRRIILSGEGNVRLAVDRLLDIDLQRRHADEMEEDALLVLRNDVRHVMANALLGVARLERGDCESAARFLERAFSLGDVLPALRTDLALALSATGRHDEAESIIGRVVEACPDDWHALDAQAVVLAAAGKEDEADLVRHRAESCAERMAEMVLYREALERRNAVGRRKGWWLW